jgi:hypothetical protein
MTTDLPAFIRDLLASPPHRGQGLNNWFFRVARVLHPLRSREEIIQLLRGATHGEPLQHNEIERAVERSAAVAWRPGESPTAKEYRPAAPRLDPERRNGVIAQESITSADLIASSPTRFPEDGPRRTEEIVDALFPGNPLICAAKTKKQAATRPRETWRGRLSALPLIVPNPMKARTGINQEGGESERCLDNTGQRKFLVIEQDGGSEDEQAAILWHLARFLPLVLVVHSGGRSLHGWFFVEGLATDWVGQFMDLACRLGADNAMRCACQLARMPDGTRETGERQCVLFFDPDALKPPANQAQPRAEQVEQEADQGVDQQAAQAEGQAASSEPKPESRAPLWPHDIEALLKDPPRYGNGLLPWIKTVANRMLRTGAEPTTIACAIHHAIKDQDFPAAELLALKSL